MRRISTTALLTAAALVMMGPQAALASCAPADPLADSLTNADVVFVGTVIDLADDDRTARFSVEEIWKGTVPAIVVVHGGPGFAEIDQARAQGQRVFTSVDRTFKIGVRYLVVPFDVSGPVFGDGACSPTAEFRAEFDAFRPQAVTFPEPIDAGPDTGPESSGGPGFAGWLALGTAAIAVAGAGAFMINRGRDTKTDPMDGALS